MGNVIPLFTDMTGFMAEVRNRGRACGGRASSRVLLLGGTYLDTYLRLQAAEIELLPGINDPEAQRKLIKAGKIHLQGMRVQAVDDDTFSVRRKRNDNEQA